MTPAEIELGFSSVIDEHDGTVLFIEKLSDRIHTLSEERNALRSALKAIEAGIWVNGGAGDVVIDGKNEKTREAQFVLACHRDAAWKENSEALAGTINDIESCERDIDLRKSALRAKELAMQFRIEQFQFLNTPRFYKET